ncbi:MAG TPA: MSEP-CTERM sorting domain-containing protein [Spirochaetota bacterium]|nr:MSEP-CTERM sorting domain-containing protein [Spirochaetota bacterium]HPU89099.1 MSEP-CTERM sorting domain-containing protein [Spirochaetota bacterium]
MIANTAARIEALIAVVRRPINWIIFGTVPQALLLVANLRSYSLVAGELDPHQNRIALSLLIAEIALLALVAVLGALFGARRREIPWAAGLPALFAAAAYLYLFTETLPAAFPRNVPEWILSYDGVVYAQFIAVMPAAFLALATAALFRTTLRFPQEVAVWSVSLAGPPVFWYLFVLLMQSSLSRNWSGAAVAAVLLPFFIATTALMFLAIIRLFALFYARFYRENRWLSLAAHAAFGIAGPIGGLLLNRAIPFPTDFQSPAVYALAVANGIVLMLPPARSVRLNRAIFLTRAAMFPFTLYFFAVFLPFLPLGIPAILAAGAGFLILTPTVLFLLHGSRLVDDYRADIARGAPRATRIMLAGALLVLPIAYTARALVDRVNIHAALDYVYEPDYEKDRVFSGSRFLLEHSLANLQETKKGVQMPFLTGYYNWIVFDNLVLPDEKMDRLHRFFFGGPMAPYGKGNVLGDIFGRRTSVAREGGRVPLPLPGRVELVSVAMRHAPAGDAVKRTVVITMKNRTKLQGEYATTVTLPVGTLVTGYWLHIGKERVPGRIFEKKTALWVYRMIKSVRRDPGILYFTGEQELALRVFPFGPHEERVTEIELTVPPGGGGAATIGGRRIDLGAALSDTANIVPATGATGVLLPPAAKRAMLPVTRAPYLHLVLDRSDATGLDAARALAAARAVLERFPRIARCALSAANFESVDILPPTSSRDRIASITAGAIDSALTRRGGFSAQREVKRILTSHRDPESAPIIVVIGRTEAAPDATRTPTREEEDNLSFFGGLAPDIDGYFMTENGSALAPVPFDRKRARAVSPLPRPVHLVRCGARTVPISTDGASELIRCDGAAAMDSIAYLDASTRAYRPLRTGPSEAAVGLAGIVDYRTLKLIPARTRALYPALVATAKRTGILNGAASYIVVESPSQWRILEEKEKQKLRNRETLEITERADEPHPALVVACALALIIILERFRKRRRNAALYS